MQRYKLLDRMKMRPYSMYENKICRDYWDGKVTKEKLAPCFTCDMRYGMNDGLSKAGKEQMQVRSREEIADEDVREPMKGC